MNVPHAPYSPPTEEEMLAVLDRVSFEHIQGIDGPESDRAELALLQFDAAETILWGRGFEAYLDELFEQHPPFGHRLTDDEKEEAFESLIFDDTNLRLSKYLLRKTLGGEEVGLAQLAERVFSRRSPNFEVNRKRMRKRVVNPLADLTIWEVQEIVAEDNNGNKRIAGYKIAAGQPLLFFFTHVYMPKRKQQHERYLSIVNRHSGENQ